MKPLVFFIFCAFFILPAAGQKGLKMLKPGELKEDYALLRKTLEEKHPALYLYNDKAAMDKVFDSCYKLLNHNLTELEFYGIIKRTVSAVHDGHCFTNPSESLDKYAAENARYFPVIPYFFEKHAVVLFSRNPEIQVGTELISINDIPVNTIKNRIFQHIISDGFIETKKYAIINSSFYFYYNIIYGQRDRYTLGCIPMTKERDTVFITAKSISAKEHNKYYSKDTQTEKHLALKIYADSTAVLSIKTFDKDALQESGVDFPAFIDSAFREIKQQKIKNLLIDLRGNGGGRDLYGSLLYSYITDKEFEYYKALETATKDLPYKKLTFPETSYNNLSPELLDSIGPGHYMLKKETHNNLQLQKPAENDFTGNVYILIDGLTFSTAAEFCSIAKSNKRAIFIGEETGGTYTSNTSGSMEKLLLPHSEIICFIPLIKYTMAIKGPAPAGRGVMPHYPFTPQASDHNGNTDLWLDFAFKLMQSR